MDRRSFIALTTATLAAPTVSFAIGFGGLIPKSIKRIGGYADEYNKTVAGGNPSNALLMGYVMSVKAYAIGIISDLQLGGITSIKPIQRAFSDMLFFYNELSRIEKFSFLTSEERREVSFAKREVRAALDAIQEYWTEQLEYVLKDLTKIEEETTPVPIILEPEPKA